MEMSFIISGPKDLKYIVEVWKMCAMITFLGQREGKIHLPELLVDM